MNISVYHEHTIEIVDSVCMYVYIHICICCSYNLFKSIGKFSNECNIYSMCFKRHTHNLLKYVCTYIYIYIYTHALPPNWGSLRESVCWRYQDLLAGGLEYIAGVNQGPGCCCDDWIGQAENPHWKLCFCLHIMLITNYIQV